MHYVAVLDDVVLAFDAHLAGRAAGGFGLERDEIVVLDDLRTDEAALEVGVDDACRAGRFVALMDGPCTAFVCACGEEGLQAEQVICALDEADDTRLFQAHFFEEHLSLVVVFEFSDFGLGLGRYDKELCVLVFDGFADGVYVCIAVDRRCVVDVADVHNRFVSQQEHVVGQGHFVVIQKGYTAAGLALKEGIAVASKERGELGGLLVAGFAGLFAFGEPRLDSLEVFDLEFGIDYLLVADRVDRAVDMDNVAVVEAAEDVENSVALAYVGEELVAKAFTLAGALDEATLGIC